MENVKDASIECVFTLAKWSNSHGDSRAKTGGRLSDPDHGDDPLEDPANGA